MTLEFRADLHTHTYCSDGSDSPLDLLKLAKASNLTGLSITDHDTIQAYTEEFCQRASELKIQILSGVEISSSFHGENVHILGYGISRAIEPFLGLVVTRRFERNLQILNWLAENGIIIQEEELFSAGPTQIIGRPHIARVLCRKGEASSIQDAFHRYLGDKKIECPLIEKHSSEEVIDAIHSAGGKAILAHPHFLKRGKFLRFLLELPFDGMECRYGSFSKEHEMKWSRLAKERNWLITGGSDYHGSIRPHIRLGCSWVSCEVFLALGTGNLSDDI